MRTTRWALMLCLLACRVVLAVSLWNRISSYFGSAPREIEVKTPIRLMNVVKPLPLITVEKPLERSAAPVPRFDPLAIFSGKLRLCPEGGATFFEAFSTVCTMRRRKRAVSFPGHFREGAVSAEEREVMRMCCDNGCDFDDLHDLCNPF
ncbi:unnamed protein product, partial [Mesorhabditis spiculigera]